MAEWTSAELLNFGRLAGFPDQFLVFLRQKAMTGEQLAQVRNGNVLMVRR
jgi:hypothetical protein